MANMAIDTTPAPPTEAPSDELDLVARAKAGDGAAFSVLINRYEGKIFRLAMNITQNREDAEDVLQEAFFKAYEHLGQFQGNSKFYTWIVRIAVNQALMKLRKRKSDRTISLDEQIDTGEDMVIREVAAWDPDPEERYSRVEMDSILTEAIDDLLPIYRTVFTLRDVDGLSTEETAEALDLTVPAVKSRLLRALSSCATNSRVSSNAKEMTPLLTCKEFLSELSDYLDEKTSAELQAKLQRHITECPNCWVICDTTKKTIQYSIRGWKAVPFPRTYIRA